MERVGMEMETGVIHLRSELVMCRANRHVVQIAMGVRSS